MSYPKKKKEIISPMMGNVYGFNQCHDQFTKEIKERIETEKLVDLVHTYTNLSWPDNDIEIIAEIYQEHMLEGLGDKK